jgi:hypothetical protein
MYSGFSRLNDWVRTNLNVNAAPMKMLNSCFGISRCPVEPSSQFGEQGLQMAGIFTFVADDPHRALPADHVHAFEKLPDIRQLPQGTGGEAAGVLAHHARPVTV